MLDQNTDRMWYVIGAIVIGAAIIAMGLNIFDESFDSVEDNFSELTSTITTMKRSNGINLLNNSHVEIEGGLNYSESKVESGEPFTGNSRPEFLRHIDLTPVFEEHGLDETYTLKFDLKSKDTSSRDKMLIYMQNGSTRKYAFVYEYVDVSTNYKTYTITGLSPKLSDATVYNSHLAFYGYYGTGNVPVVRNVRLEKEVPLF